MKKALTLLLMLLILLGLASFNGCRKDRKDEEPRAEDGSCFYRIQVKTADPCDCCPKKKTIRIPFRCNQIIVRTDDLSVFDSLGYTPLDTCSCSPDLMVLQTPAGVDPIGVIENPPPGLKDESMTLNFFKQKNDLFQFFEYNINPDNYPAPVNEGPAVVRVGVVDTGLDPGSGFLQDYLWENRGVQSGCPGLPPANHGIDVAVLNQPEIDDQAGHGSHCSGIVAGIPPAPRFSQKGVRIEIVTAKISEDSKNEIDLFTATCGIHYVLKQNVQAINLSWGFLSHTLPDGPEIMLPALKEAAKNGVVIVAALGNDSLQLGKTLKFWPASFSETWDNVIAVGSSSDLLGINRDILSNYYDEKTLLAPGRDILSTVPNPVRRWDTDLQVLTNEPTQGYAYATGTSMAAPFVARTVAYMLGKRNPGPPDIGTVKRHILTNSANGFNPLSLIQTW